MKKKSRFFYKTIFYMWIFLNIMGCGNKGNNSKECIPVSEGVFNPALKEILENFIYSFNEKYTNENYHIFFYVYFYEKNSNCYVIISTDLSYSKEFIKGYTYLDNELIVLYENEKEPSYCKGDFINISYLTIFQDSVPGFQEDGYIQYDYDVPGKVYKIISKDSLEFIGESW